MKEIVIISGKGGTGKTSITASLTALAQNSVIVDCDVDAADLHILLSPEVEKRERFISGKLAAIKQDQCKNCGICVKHCKFGAIRSVDGTWKVDSAMCEGCGLCDFLCPAGAIDFQPRDCGEWFKSKTKYGPMIHAKLGIAAENSGRLVSLIKEEAKKCAQENGKNLILVDGPPGIGCPVIASISGADCVLVITEPTMSGIHDLNRALELTDHFGIETLVAVNRYDINPDNARKIKKICFGSKAKYVGKISSDQSMVDAQIQGKSIVEYGNSKCIKEIENIWFNVKNWVEQ
ncbi:MAG: (4Fe-4S)-binding protein [Gammaproteobacteria bacterium]|nr:MAG: (4Fe-4S)-binding protein [Gammaproteobacteria bacterium]